MSGGAEEQGTDSMTVIRKAVRTARLQVRPDGTLRVVAPPSFDVDAFVQRNAAWIEKRRGEFDLLASGGNGREDLLLLHGRYHRPVPGARFGIDGTSGTITVPSPAALRRRLAKMLKEEVQERLESYPDLTGRWTGRIAVRMQKTRWGSCSSSGNLNINLRVIALPDSLREYIIVHEAAHLREPNHSKRFWLLVANHCPGHREAGSELRRYRVIIERNRVWRAIQDAG